MALVELGAVELRRQIGEKKVSPVELMQACIDRLPAGGRLVANAVTAESEALLVEWHSRLGGELRRFQHYRGEPLGGFTGWRPLMPITQWTVTML